MTGQIALMECFGRPGFDLKLETFLSRGALLEDGDGENFGQKKHLIYESAAKLNRPQIFNRPQNYKPFTKKKGYVMKMGMNLLSGAHVLYMNNIM